MSWIREIAAAQDISNLGTSLSIAGKQNPSLEMLDAKIETVVKKILENSNFKKNVFLEEQRAPKNNRFLRGRHTANMSYEHFRVTGTHESVVEFSDLLSVTLRAGDGQGFDTKWDKVLTSMNETPKDDVLESTYRQKLRESGTIEDHICPAPSRYCTVE